MGTVPPVNVSLIDQLQIGLVNECSGLQGVAEVSTAQAAGCPAMELCINHGDKLRRSFRPPVRKLAKQRSYVFRRELHNCPPVSLNRGKVKEFYPVRSLRWQLSASNVHFS